MNEDNHKEAFLLLVFPATLFFVFLIASLIIMPENCYLYETRQLGQLCHTFPQTEPCPVCKDLMTATLARVLFALSFVFLLLPVAVGLIRERRRPAEKTNLLD